MPVTGRHSKVHRFRITLSQRAEVDYWTRVLDTTEEAMRQAIEVVGDHALRVREYLDAKRAPAVRREEESDSCGTTGGDAAQEPECR